MDDIPLNSFRKSKQMFIPIINACVRLAADHPLQPPMIEPIQFSPADAEGVDDHTR